MKKTSASLIIAVMLPLITQSAFAQVLLKDNFTVDANSNDPNFELANRQGGTQALCDYRSNGGQHQVGNPGTLVGQPGGATNSNYLLLAVGGGVQGKTDLAAAATGPLVISFDMYFHSSGNPNNGDPTDWGAFSLKATSNDGFPVVGGAGEFGFLSRYNGGIQVFQNGNSSLTPSGWDTPGFALADHWVLTFTDTAGTGSAFNGNGSKVTMVNGTTTLGTITLGQLNSSLLYPGFDQPNLVFVGVANLSIAVVPPTTAPNFSFEENAVAAGSVSAVVPAGWSGFNKAHGDFIGSQHANGTDYTVFDPMAAPADGNQYCFINLLDPTVTGGIYQDVGALQPNSIYTLTVAIGSRADRINSPGIISLINGTNNTGTLLAAGGGLPVTQDTWQDYTATFATGPVVSGDLTIALSTVGNATTIQADFDNVRLGVQHSVVPLPTRVQDISPVSATVAVGSNVVFTAVFSNSPPVSLQWQQVVNGVTNAISAGVGNVTSSGVVTSTLTLNNVQMSSAGSYRLQAVNATNSAGVVYTSSALLTVVPTITWYAAGTYNSSFADDSVLTYAGTLANEVYGVDFGGSGALVTANGYAFDDYASSGNMSVVSSGLTSFGGYLGSASTGDGNLDIILNNGVYGSSANTATLNNLTVGQTYTVLVLLDDTRASGGGPNFDVADGLTVSPSQRYAFPGGSPAVGGFIMGTFTAQATTQPLTVLNGGNSQYNAVLLEKGIAAAPPIPPSLTTDNHPLLSEVATGGAVTLSVAATGAQPITYQWFNQAGPISGATNASYSFSAVSGTNNYYVAVTNFVSGLVSATATVISSTNIVTVNNFSFENGTGGSGGLVFPLAWTPFSDNNFSVVANNGFSVLNPLAPTAQGNDYFAINEGPSDPTGGIYQDVGPLLPNTLYTLTVAIGRSVNFTPLSGLGSPGIISLLNGTNNTGTLLAGTTGIPATPDNWQDYTVTFITGASVSGDLVVELAVAGASTYQAAFDNVRLTQASAPASYPPTLTKDLRAATLEVATGTPLSLSVTANGSLPLHYQWFNANGPIAQATNSSYAFNALAGTNSYYVGVTNVAGGIVSSTAVVVSSPAIVTVNNFSFELDATTAGGVVHGAPTSWASFNQANSADIGSQNAGGTDYTVFDPLAPTADENQYCYVNMFNPSVAGGIYQDVGALQPNTAYTLTVAIGSRADRINTPGNIALVNGTSPTGTVLASGGGLPATQNTWQDYTAGFTSGASVSGDLTIVLSAFGVATVQADFDNVRLTKALIPTINPPKYSGGKLVLTGTVGLAGGGYLVLTTTNLSAPNWTTNTTGTLDASGSFSNAIPVNPLQPASFFRLQLQ